LPEPSVIKWGPIEWTEQVKPIGLKGFDPAIGGFYLRLLSASITAFR
jgi:hypothetical protein